MTTRLMGFAVALEEDMREDDAECLMASIRLLRHVASVEPVESNITHQISRMQIRGDIERKLWEVLKPDYLKKDKNG